MTKAGHSPGALMAALAHPARAEAEALRAILHGLKTPQLDECAMGNAPSCTLGETHCFTLNFGDRKCIRLPFHCDKARKETKDALPAFTDETGLLAWQSDIPAIAAFRSQEEVAASKKVLPGLVQRWVTEILEA